MSLAADACITLSLEHPQADLIECRPDGDWIHCTIYTGQKPPLVLYLWHSRLLDTWVAVKA
jgi:hypothetical protein